MTAPIFRRTIFISLTGHFIILSILNFSFGTTLRKPKDYESVSFLGQLLGNSQVAKPLHLFKKNGLIKKELFATKPNAFLSNKIEKVSFLYQSYYVKPHILLAKDIKKGPLTKVSYPVLISSPRKDHAIIFHPVLPYHFTLYFKDRQVAHVELMFNMVPKGPRNSIFLKRKISSGNLEVDLLTMRYMGHYLFIQQSKFSPNAWRTIKVDLSAQDDK
jgi:hypothetical protein